ncbi:Oxidoreductase domain protein [metagenome]|uniref:Oxidoreductase domain protein n=1 Tax=metagenome TaxID=256318 RepID=A0A2P2C9H9_9ZZZZ
MTVRWGIAATGKMADVFVPDFAHVEGAEVVAVGSRREESAAAFAARHGIPRHGSYRALLDDPAVDVVYIATPHPQHRALALAAIAAGKGVLVEKAFTATLAGAQEVVAAARAAEVFAMEAMWTRFQPVVATARELIAAGEIGEPLMVQADLGAFRAYDPADRLFDPALGGGAVLDLGVYVISIAQHFLGDPDRVTATGRLFPNGVDASVTILMSYDDGRSASVIASLESASGGRAVVMGTRGSIELAPRFHHPTTIIVRRNGEAAEEISAQPRGRGYCHEIDEVNRCIEAGLTQSDVMPLADTLGVQRVMQEALEQLGCGPREADHSPV